MPTETWKLKLEEMWETDKIEDNTFLLVVAGKEEYKTIYEIRRKGQVWSTFKISDVDGPSKAVEMYHQFRAGFYAYEDILSQGLNFVSFMDL